MNAGVLALLLAGLIVAACGGGWLLFRSTFWRERGRTLVRSQPVRIFVRLLWGGFWLGIALFWVSQGSVSPNLFKAFVIVLLLLSGAVMAKRIAEHHRKRAAG